MTESGISAYKYIKKRMAKNKQVL